MHDGVFSGCVGYVWSDSQGFGPIRAKLRPYRNKTISAVQASVVVSFFASDQLTPDTALAIPSGCLGSLLFLTFH
jgi:hypothetical protein